MIRTLAVLAGGFLGFAAALMIAMEPPGSIPGVGGDYGYEMTSRSDGATGQFDGELDIRPAPNVMARVGVDGASAQQGVDTIGNNVPRVRVKSQIPDRASDLYRLQFELARIDCFDAAIDGKWSLVFHERLAHVALAQELDVSAFQSVDQMLRALRNAPVGICAGVLENEVAQAGISTDRGVAVVESVEAQPPLRSADDVPRRRVADEQDAAELSSRVDEGVTAYRQLDEFVAQDPGPNVEAKSVSEVVVVAVARPARPYVAPSLSGRHADSYPLRDEVAALSDLSKGLDIGGNSIIITEGSVAPTVAVVQPLDLDPELTPTVPVPALVSSALRADSVEPILSSPVDERVVQNMASLVIPAEIVSDASEPLSLPVIIEAQTYPSEIVLEEAGPEVFVMPLPARRAVALVRVFGADFETAALPKSSARSARIKRSRTRVRTTRARVRAKPAVKKVTVRKAKAKPKPKPAAKAGSWKNNRKAIFGSRG